MKRTTTELHSVCSETQFDRDFDFGLPSETQDVEEDDVFFPLAIRILV
jgi:hypothetical protein